MTHRTRALPPERPIKRRSTLAKRRGTSPSFDARANMREHARTADVLVVTPYAAGRGTEVGRRGLEPPAHSSIHATYTSVVPLECIRPPTATSETAPVGAHGARARCADEQSSHDAHTSSDMDPETSRLSRKTERHKLRNFGINARERRDRPDSASRELESPPRRARNAHAGVRFVRVQSPQRSTKTSAKIA